MAEAKRGSLILLCVLVVGIALAAGCGSDDDQTSPLLDTIAPSIPLELSAGESPMGGGVKLDWAANTVDPDLAGYIVYRSSSPDRGYQPLNQRPVTTNSFLDTQVRSGRSYWYSVSAQDVHQNESARSTRAQAEPGQQVRDRN